MLAASGRRNGWLLLALAMTASGALALARFHSFQVGAYYDDAHYVVLSEALAAGKGMRLVSYPEAPPEWAFPPGWPLLLAPLSALFPGSYDVVKLLSLACWLGSIPLVYRLSAGRLGPPWRGLLTLLVALHPALVATAGMVMSEAPYLFFSLLALVLFEAWNEREGPGARPGLLLGAAATAVWAQLVRTVGIALLLAMAAMAAAPLLRRRSDRGWERRWRDAGLAAGAVALCLLPQLAWGLWGGGALLSPGYRFHLFEGSPLARLAQMAANAREYTVILPDLLLPLFGPRLAPALAGMGLGWVPAAVRAVLLAAAFAGFVLSLRRPRALELYAVAYLAAVLTFWNPVLESAQERYLLPLLPFLYLCLLKTCEALTGWIAGRTARRRDEAEAGLPAAARAARPVRSIEANTAYVTARANVAAMLLAAPLLLLLLVRNVQDALHPVREAMTDLAAGAAWIAAHAPADAVVMTKDPVQDYLYARRRTIRYPKDARDLDATVSGRSVDYVLLAPRLARRREKDLDPFTASEILPALRARPDRYVEVYRDPAANATVFAVREPPKATAGHQGRP